MTRFTLTKRVNAPLADVWRTWDNFGDIYRFNPLLRHSHLLGDTDQPTGIGSERHCDMADGKNWVRERIVDYRPMKAITIDAYDGSMPLRKLVAAFQFREITPEMTSVQMQVSFEPKFGLVGKLMAPMMKRQFRKMLQRLLDCNAAHVERGEVVPAAA